MDGRIKILSAAKQTHQYYQNSVCLKTNTSCVLLSQFFLLSSIFALQSSVCCKACLVYNRRNSNKTIYDVFVLKHTEF